MSSKDPLEELATGSSVNEPNSRCFWASFGVLPPSASFGLALVVSPIGKRISSKAVVVVVVVVGLAPVVIEGGGNVADVAVKLLVVAVLAGCWKEVGGREGFGVKLGA